MHFSMAYFVSVIKNYYDKCCTDNHIGYRYKLLAISAKNIGIGNIIKCILVTKIFKGKLAFKL